MKHTLTEVQTQAFPRLQKMMSAYLVERNAEKMLSFFPEDVQSIGTGIQEVIFNKAQLRALVTEEIAPPSVSNLF